MLAEFPLVAAQHPFGWVWLLKHALRSAIDRCHRIVAKETNLSYHLEKVFDIDIPALHHGNDGLIYTCVSAPYTPGTDRNMYVYSLPPRQTSHHLHSTFQIEMEATIRELYRLQIGPKIPPFRHESIPTRLLRQAHIRVVRVVGRGGPEGEL